MKINNKRLIIFLGGILFFFFGLGEHPSSLWAKTAKKTLKTRLIQIEEQELPDRIRVTLKTNQSVVHRSFPMTDPPRLVIDLKPCLLGPQKTYTVKDPSVSGVRLSQFNSQTVRIVFDFSQPPVFQVSHKKGTPYQIIVDFPKIKPQVTEAVPKKTEEKYLPQTTIEAFKKEIVLEERQEKEKIYPKKNRYGFDFYMQNLHNVFRTIGEVGEINIAVSDDVKEKKVTLSLKEVTWEEALEIILDSNYLKKIKRGDKTIFVTSNDNFKKIQDEENKTKFEAIKREQEELKAEEQRQKVGKILRITREFKIKNVDVDLVQKILRETEKKEFIRSPGIYETVVDRVGTGVQGGGYTSSMTTQSGSSVQLVSIPHTKTLLARGTESDLDYIEQLINAIDQPATQVMIEARIVEADANFTRDIGIRWGGGAAFGNTNAPFGGIVRGGEAGAPGSNYAVNLPLASTSSAFGGLGFAFASTNLNIDVRIQAMEQQGRGKTISSPKVLTLDSKEATIKQGQSIPVTTRTENNTFSTIYRDAALVLKVTPHINSNKKIRIELDLSKNEPDFTKVDSLGNPTIKTKEAKAEMIINDGDTVVIGGIIFKKESITDNKIPGLGNIPFLGWLFKTRYKATEDTELLIFLTPTIQKSSLPDRFGNDK